VGWEGWPAVGYFSSSARTSWAPAVSNVRRSTSVVMTTCSAWAADAAGVAPGTVLDAAAGATGTLGTEGVAPCASALACAPEDDSALVEAGGVPKSDGLPLLTCQLFHRSNS